LNEEIEKYSNLTNAANEIDEEAVYNALRQYEEELETDMKDWEKKIERLGDKANDNQIRKGLKATAKFNYVSLELGENSPAK
jgi:predicted transcriptional regulator